jgi:hypothetical protein
MRYACIAPLSAATAGLVAFAAPAWAGFEHPVGCARCSGAYSTARIHQGALANGRELRARIPLAATAAAPETVVADPNSPGGCLWGVQRYLAPSCP